MSRILEGFRDDPDMPGTRELPSAICPTKEIWSVHRSGATAECSIATVRIRIGVVPGKAFGDVIEWRIDREGMAVSAILRTWEIGDDDRIVQSLRVFAINSDAACVYAIVRTNSAVANEKAAGKAEDASHWTCTKTATNLEGSR